MWGVRASRTSFRRIKTAGWSSQSFTFARGRRISLIVVVKRWPAKPPPSPPLAGVQRGQA